VRCGPRRLFEFPDGQSCQLSSIPDSARVPLPLCFVLDDCIEFLGGVVMADGIEVHRSADVLIVESREPIRLLLRQFIELSLPCPAVVEAADGEGALELACLQRPWLALMYLGARDFDGIDFITQLRSAQPRTRVIGIVAEQDDIAHQFTARALAAGAYACVREFDIATDLLQHLLQCLDDTEQVEGTAVDRP
jgi:CheY-like chemotaxis protein